MVFWVLGLIRSQKSRFRIPQTGERLQVVLLSVSRIDVYLFLRVICPHEIVAAFAVLSGLGFGA